MQTLLPFFGVVRVTGEDSALFLNGQLSNDIQHLAENQACFATYNTPQGRVLANMLVLHQHNAFYLVMAKELVESMIQRLKMFVLRSKVQFELLPDWGVSGSLKDDAQPILPQSPALILPIDKGELLLPHSGSLNIAPKDDLPAFYTESEQRWQQHEIQSGYPWIGAPTSGLWVAQMLNQHTIGGIHFRKGCYVGQEIIARAQYRGQVKRGLALVYAEHTLPLASKIFNQHQQEAAQIVNATSSWHLVVIKHEMVKDELFDENGRALTIKTLFFDSSTS